jgi:RES domain-containing protein
LVPVVSRVEWRPCYRIISSRFPPVGLYERVARPEDLEAVFAIENLTNPRVRQELGEIDLVPPGERIVGEGATPIMAAFTHLNPEGSRFSDGAYGVYYAAHSLDTAIAETRYHRERFLARTKEGPIELDMRTYLAELAADLHDLRGRTDLADVYDAGSYVAGQRLGAQLKGSGSSGIVYDSVRDPGAECAAVFRPRALSNCMQGPHFGYVWDGSRITAVIRKTIEKTY